MSEPSREDWARLIWRDGKMDEYEDKCDMDVTDMPSDHPAWVAADAILARLALRAAKPERERVQEHVNRIFGAIHDYSDMAPEADETWESWYHAAFDLLSAKIKIETDAIRALKGTPA